MSTKKEHEKKDHEKRAEEGLDGPEAFVEPDPADKAGDNVSAKEPVDIARQAAEYKEKYLRILAEFDNARKRQERERTEFMKYANEGLLIDFLNIVDDLDRTVIVAKEKHQDYDAFLKGVEMVMKRVNDLLKKNGVEEVDPAGKPFDPYAHEILMQEPSADHENGMVIASFQKGYKIGDRVIRTAKVKVADNTAIQENTPETA